MDFKQRNDGDAGWDLYATDDYLLAPVGYNSYYKLKENPVAERVLVKTGISVAFSSEYYLRVAPRSGLAYKQGIDVLAGVIDSSYRGEIGVILVNLGTEGVVIHKGDRIAQLVPEKISKEQFEFVEDLDDTDRGSGGFGSTGK